MSDDELLERFGGPAPRYTSYPTALHFHDGVGAEQYGTALERASETSDALAAYIHIPFCLQRCHFCACTTVVSPHVEKVVGYLDELRTEIDLVAHRMGRSRALCQLHIGGGTPTYFRAHQLAVVLEHLLERFTLSPDAEFSVELDPRVTTVEQMRVLSELGLNRVSLGVQDVDPVVQAAVGRVQPFYHVRRCAAVARDLGVGSVNVDLIYGLPHQTTDSIRRTLDEVLKSLFPDRLAIYAFAHLPDLKRHQKKLDTTALPDAGTRLAMQRIIRDSLWAAGFVDIGMDHYARPDDELAVAQREGRLGRNFMGYTVHRAPEMLGFGLSAIGFVGGAYVQNTRKLADWQTSIDAADLATERGVVLSYDDMVRARVIEDLMCNFRVDKASFASMVDTPFDSYFESARARLAEALAWGLMEWGCGELTVTELGRPFVRRLAMAFDTYTDSDVCGEYSAAV